MQSGRGSMYVCSDDLSTSVGTATPFVRVRRVLESYVDNNTMQQWSRFASNSLNRIRSPCGRFIQREPVWKLVAILKHIGIYSFFWKFFLTVLQLLLLPTHMEDYLIFFNQNTFYREFAYIVVQAKALSWKCIEIQEGVLTKHLEIFFLLKIKFEYNKNCKVSNK